MSRRDLALMLAMTPGVGGKTLTRILTRNDLHDRSPDEFLKLPSEALVEEYRLKQPIAEAISGGKDMRDQIKPLREHLERAWRDARDRC